MLIYQDWMKSNIGEVLYGMQGSFRVWFEPYRFQPQSFMQEAEYTAKLISYSYPEDLCLGLTGGADSEFIARLFSRLKINFLPIIVKSPCNEHDWHRAIRLCNELDLPYYESEVTEEEVLNYFVDITYKKYHNDGLNYTYQMMVADLAKTMGMVAILGETHVYDPNPSQSIVRAFKFLADFRYHDVIPFYYYTPSIALAEMKEIRDTDTAQAFKSRVRGTVYRDKIYPKYSPDTMLVYHSCIETLDKKKLMYDMGTPQDFINQMEKFIV